MSENLRAYTRALYAFDAAAARVAPDQWDRPSPCAEWTAREVLGHVTWGTLAVAARAAGEEPPREASEAEIAGDDPYASFVAAREAVLGALDHEGVLQTVAETPFGEMPIDTFLGIYTLDPLVHAWDVATATGQPHGIDDAAAERALEGVRPLDEMLRGPGRFGDKVEADAGDAATRLAAFTGRQV